MKKIIAFSRNIAAPEHPIYGWFCDRSNSHFNGGRPLIFRFGNDETEACNQETPWFDYDNNIKLYWYDNEIDAEYEEYKYIDYEYVCGGSSITFLFDDRTTRQFKTPGGNCIWSEWDRAKKEPIGVYKELVKFLEDYIRNGGYKTASKYMLVPEVEFMDI